MKKEISLKGKTAIVTGGGLLVSDSPLQANFWMRMLTSSSLDAVKKN